MARPTRAELEQAWRTVHTMWLGECAFAVVVWAGLPRILQGGLGASSMPLAPVPIFIMVSLADLAIGYWFKRQGLAAASSETGTTPSGGTLPGLSTVAVATGGAPVIFGIVAYAIGGGMNALSALCALALIGLLFLRPNLEEWEAATMRGAGGDAGRRSRG